MKDKPLNNFAKFKLIEQSKFYFRDSENIRLEEEIDLVIVTDTTIIIGEIKCSTYPLESDDFYSTYQTLKKAKIRSTEK